MSCAWDVKFMLLFCWCYESVWLQMQCFHCENFIILAGYGARVELINAESIRIFLYTFFLRELQRVVAVTIEDSASLRIERVRVEMCHLWKFSMQIALEKNDLWKTFSGTVVEPEGDRVTEVQIKKFRKRERKATTSLSIRVGQLPARSGKTAKEAWHGTNSKANIR